MKSKEILKHEHTVILVVTRAMEREAGRIRRTGEVRVDHVKGLLDFIHNFVNRCHHTKEEKVLFARLERAGILRTGGPIGVMLDEHLQGREHVREVDRHLAAAGAGARAAQQIVAGNLEAYAKLMGAHIEKENHILLPLAQHVLTPTDHDAVTNGFERVEREEMGIGEHERFHYLAESLMVAA